MEIAVWGLPAGDGHVRATPFGEVSVQPASIAGRSVGLVGRDSDPRARAVATKALGAQRVIAVFDGEALGAAVSADAMLAPVDLLDQTRGGPTTFFTGRGLGYLPAIPPFCPETRAALLSGRGVVEGGTAVACPPRFITPAESRAWRALGGDVAVWGLAPEWSLARELELCYAALVSLGRSTDWLAALAELLPALPPARGCECSRLNAAARREVGEDWREWIDPS